MSQEINALDEALGVCNFSRKQKSRLKRFRDYIEESNAAFKKMTRRQKRVQIARDVLVQVRSGRYHASSTYLSSFDIERVADNFVDDEKKQNTELRELFARMPECSVCGIGSVFVSSIDRLDKLKLKDVGGDIDDRNNMVEYLVEMKLFTEEELDLIEEAFENDSGPDRLRSIMRRIIKGEGREIDRDMLTGLVAQEEEEEVD